MWCFSPQAWLSALMSPFLFPYFTLLLPPRAILHRTTRLVRRVLALPLFSCDGRFHHIILIGVCASSSTHNNVRLCLLQPGDYTCHNIKLLLLGCVVLLEGVRVLFTDISLWWSLPVIVTTVTPRTSGSERRAKTGHKEYKRNLRFLVCTFPFLVFLSRITL